MASKEIKFKIKLDIDGQERITTAIASTKQLKDAIEGTKDKTDAFHSSVYKINQAFTAWSNIKKSFEGLDNALSALASSYRNVEVANKRLATVMEERMSATAADISAVQKAIKAQTQLGIIGGSVQKAGAQQVATFLTQKEALLTLIPAMNDLIAQQKGLNASEQDAQAIGNLFGKVMQGQTSALKRVGITFTEAQEQVLKMGTEQERAAMLAEVVTANVGHMNAALGNTAAGSMKQFSNWLAGIKVKMGEFANYIQPTLSMVTSFAMLAASAQGAFLAISNVGKAIGVTKALAISVRFLRFEWIAIKSALQAFILVVRVSRAQNISLAASFKLVATASTTAKIAMRGFMSATVVGAALMAVGFAIEKLIGYFSKSTDAINDNTEAIEDNASALTQAERTKKAVSEIQDDAATHYADEIGKVKALTSVIHDSNAKYADRIEAIRNLQSIIPGYHAQIQKDGTIFERNAAAVDKYIRKLEDLAMAEAAFDKIKAIGKEIVTLRVKQRKYQKDAEDIDNTIKSENGGKGANELDNPLNRFTSSLQDNVKVDAVGTNGSINFNYQRDMAARQIQSRQKQERLSGQLTNFHIATGSAADIGSQIEEKEEDIQAILGILTPSQRSAYNGIAANGGYVKGGGAPSLATPGKGGHTTPHTTTGGANTTADTPQQGSLKDLDQQIAKLREEAQATADVTEAQEKLAQAAALTAQRKDLAIRLGIEAPDKAEVRDKMDVLQELLHNAEKDYEQADTTETKQYALERINIWKNQIEALQAQRIVLQLEVDPQGAKQTIQSLRRTKYSEAQTRANTVQSDLADGLIDQSEANRQIKQINDDFAAQIGKGFKPITLQVDTDQAEHGIKRFATESRKAWSGITSGVDAVQSLTETLQGNGTVWEKLTAVINTFFSVMDTVTSIMEVITPLIRNNTTATQSDTQTTNQDTTAKIGHAGATAVDAGAEATKQGSKLPFPANIAAIAVGVAAVVAAIATISSLAFASGGIVPGTSYTGDRITARVNSGEMILNPRQQANLWRLANTPIAIPNPNATTNNPTPPTLNLAALRASLQTPSVNVNLTGRIRGRDIITVLANTTLTESGSTTTAVNITYPDYANGSTKTLTLSPATTAKAGIMTTEQVNQLSTLRTDMNGCQQTIADIQDDIRAIKDDIRTIKPLVGLF